MWLISLPPGVLFAVVVALASGKADGNRSRLPLTAHATANAPTHARPDSTPLYTEDQATAGAAVFGRVCAECHEKKDVAGADFRAKWTGRTLFELFELVRSTMPDSNPGGLTRDEYSGAVAYILKLNALPAGTTPVMPDSAAMQSHKLDLPPPSN